MNNHKNKGIVFVAIVASLLIGSAAPAHADSDWWHRWWGHDREVRHDRREIQDDKNEIRDDRKELGQDRRELRQDLRNGASRGEIEHDRR